MAVAQPDHGDVNAFSALGAQRSGQPARYLGDGTGFLLGQVAEVVDVPASQDETVSEVRSLVSFHGRHVESDGLWVIEQEPARELDLAG